MFLVNIVVGQFHHVLQRLANMEHGQIKKNPRINGFEDLF